MKLKLFLLFSTVLVGSGFFGYLLTPHRTSAQSLGESKSDLPADLNAPGFFKAPKGPKLKGNKNLSTDKFITKERAIGKISAKTKLLDSKLKGWKDFRDNNLQDVIVDDIDQDRMVWEVDLQFPEGIQVGGNKYYDAVVNQAVDAETGEVVYFKVSTSIDKFKKGKGVEKQQN
jgi:hypothetical protein